MGGEVLEMADKHRTGHHFFGNRCRLSQCLNPRIFLICSSHALSRRFA
jgi:hypothetical protein